MPYETPEPGPDNFTPWVQPIRSGYKMQCCDCDLVHTMEFRTRSYDNAGNRTLTEYDGVMTLPEEAMDLLERNGVDVREMRRIMS
jgi:hypothetical protein